MTSTASRTLALTLATLFAAGAPTARAEYCATQPPPEGLVARCQALTLVVPATREALEMSLLHWMEGCAINSRAPELVMGNQSVDDVWELIKDKYNTPYNSVRILPDYTSNTFRSQGRTCYGIESVTFDVAGAQGVVEEDGPSSVTSPTSAADYSDEQIRDAATAGLAALQAHPGNDATERARMQNILVRMRSYGSDFNDLYYAVAPDSDLTGTLNPPACFKDGGFPPRCDLADNARRNCARHIAPEIVTAHLGGDTSAQFASKLLVTANDIARAKRYLVIIQNADSPAAVPCPVVSDVLMPEIGRLAADPKSIYNAWDAGP